jgi:exodeoxyribonuclease V alpha subunit
VTILPFPKRPPPEPDDGRARHHGHPAQGSASHPEGDTWAAADGPRVAPGETDHDLIAVLAPWRDHGVLDDADVHGAEALCRTCGVGADRPEVVLAAALALRAPRVGHTCLDLASVARSVPAELEGELGVAGAIGSGASLVWPDDIVAWGDAVAGTELVAGPHAPLVLEGTRLYLERYHRYEVSVADELVRRASTPERPLRSSAARRDELLDALLPVDDRAGATDGVATQRRAALQAATRPVAVVVGGPGTGKTHTVAALLGLLLDDAAGDLRVALVAPTGKAAARLGESLRQRAAGLRASRVAGADLLADQLESAEVSTLHRLLGARAGSTRLRHHAGSPLADDVVIVDETSMVALPLMARLLDALRPEARLVLVGDPGQLASVEAGSVLGDVAGPAVRARLAGEPTPAGPLAEAVSVLTRSFRFPPGSPIDRFATAVRAGDADAALATLAAPPTVSAAPSAPAEATPPNAAAVQGVLSFDPPPPDQPVDHTIERPARVSTATGVDARAASTSSSPVLAAGGVAADVADVGDLADVADVGDVAGGPVGGDDAVGLDWIRAGGDEPDGRVPVLAQLEGNARRVRAHAERGDAAAALRALAEVRVLCAHRRGPFGVSGWNRLVESGLAADRPLAPGFYVGRPVLVTANDRTNGVFNGDLGVTVATPDGARVAFPAVDAPRTIPPVRLASVETVHAMTIHKSQGSEFDHVVVVLPPETSRLATRELLYTAVTRARLRVTLVGSADAVRAGVENRVERASGLAERLWPDARANPG